jgi:hypothetical protein
VVFCVRCKRPTLLFAILNARLFLVSEDGHRLMARMLVGEMSIRLTVLGTVRETTYFER